MDLSEPRAVSSETNPSKTSRTDSDVFLTNDLKNQIKLKDKTIKRLEKEISVQKGQLEVQDEAIERAEDRAKLLEEKTLEIESEIKSLRKNERKWSEERKRLLAQVEAASKEADRLNHLMLEYAGNNSEVMNGSMEDVVRLHNQVSHSRKEIENLREEIKSLKIVVQAKDVALEQYQKDFAMVEDSVASRKEDQNTIVDLQRQLNELESQLGGEHQLGKMAETEIDQIRSVLSNKEQELDVALDKIEAQREQVQEAKRLKAKADEMMVAAADKMAQAVDISDRAIAAEAERMQLGGFVRKDVHNAEVLALSSDLEMYKNMIQLMKEENSHAKALLKRVLGTVDEGIDAALSGNDLSEKFGNSVITIQELRKEVNSLQDILQSKEASLASANAAKAAANVRAQKSLLCCLQAKQHLAKTIGEYDYTLLMHEPPPTEEEIMSATENLDSAKELEKAVSYESLLKDHNKLKEERKSMSKTIEGLTAKIDTLQENAKKSAFEATKREKERDQLLESKAAACNEKDEEIMALKSVIDEREKERDQLLESKAAACNEKDEEIMALKSVISKQNSDLEHLCEENGSIKDELVKLRDQDQASEKLKSDHDILIADMKEKQSSVMKELEELKVCREQDLKECLTQNENPVQIQLNIIVEQVQRQEKIEDVIMIEEQPIISAEDTEEAEPVTPKESKSPIWQMEESRPREFAREYNVGVVSPEALSEILDSLVASKESNKNIQGDALYHEAIEMLQGELSRLSLEMASDSEIANKLRNEVGDLKTARLSAETTAELLESYNAMSMKLAALKSIAAQREDVFARHEQQMLNEISDLRMEIRRLKGKSTLKSVKKAFSSTVKGIKKSLDTTPRISTVTSVSPLGDTALQTER